MYGVSNYERKLGDLLKVPFKIFFSYIGETMQKPESSGPFWQRRIKKEESQVYSSRRGDETGIDVDV